MCRKFHQSVDRQIRSHDFLQHDANQSVESRKDMFICNPGSTVAFARFTKKHMENILRNCTSTFDSPVWCKVLDSENELLVLTSQYMTRCYLSLF